MVLQSVKNIVENTQWKMHDFDSEYAFSTSSVKYVVENERSQLIASKLHVAVPCETFTPMSDKFQTFT